MNDEEKLAIENLKRLSKTKPYIIWGDGTPYNKSNQIYTILNLIEKQEKIIQAMAKYLAEEDETETFCINPPMNCDCDYIDKKCEDCIIEYFAKKVGNE